MKPVICCRMSETESRREILDNSIVKNLQLKQKISKIQRNTGRDCYKAWENIKSNIHVTGVPEGRRVKKHVTKSDQFLIFLIKKPHRSTNIKRSISPKHNTHEELSIKAHRNQAALRTGAKREAFKVDQGCG